MNSIRTKEGYAPRRKRWDEALGLSAICKLLTLRGYSLTPVIKPL